MFSSFFKKSLTTSFYYSRDKVFNTIYLTLSL